MRWRRLPSASSKRPLRQERRKQRASRRATRSAAGWLPRRPPESQRRDAAAAACPCPPAFAFAQVQQHFRDFRTLRFDVEQRMNGNVLMKSRVHVTRDGNVRTDVGDLISVIVNSSEGRVMTLHHGAHVATVAPLGVPVTKRDAMAWLKEIREFQGEARALPRARMIDLRKAYGWELATTGGNIVLWATEDGLPLEMTLGGGAPLQLNFDFEFDPALPAQMFSTEIPGGL